MSTDVGIIMGSRSDWETMQHASNLLDQLGVSFEVRVVSAHRTPDLLFEYAETAVARGLGDRDNAELVRLHRGDPQPS